MIIEIFQKKLDGYKFPVYSTPFCPGNESEWNKRSSAISCNKTNGYTCLPNENFTELLEFCYTQPWILIEEGIKYHIIVFFLIANRLAYVGKNIYIWIRKPLTLFLESRFENEDSISDKRNHIINMKPCIVATSYWYKYRSSVHDLTYK